MRVECALAAAVGLLVAFGGGQALSADGEVIKKTVDARDGGENLLKPGKWGPWREGFTREGGVFVCDNGSDAEVHRGASQSVELNQKKPEPVVAVAFSKAEGVGGAADSDYSLYLDLVYTDGTPLWGRVATFSTGTHGWERREVVVFPAKPVKTVSVHMLLRRHSGRAYFKEPRLSVMRPPAGACLFDGVAVSPVAGAAKGFAVRDVAAGSAFHRIEKSALGLGLAVTRSEEHGARFFDVTLKDTTGADRAVTLYYSVPVKARGLEWLAGPRESERASPPSEHMVAGGFRAGANGRLSKWPLAAVADRRRGTAVGIDLDRPAFYRLGYNAGTEELFIAYDIGLAPEKPRARVRFCTFDFDPAWGFRSALAKYYEVFPDQFVTRVKKQGLWMPFARISAVKGWEDFGFRIKEGNNETRWDDEHDIITFRYTEPMTWWMKMPKGMPRTQAAALAHAKALAAGGDRRAKSFLASGFHGESGGFVARLRNTPWCDGAVWSINSMPGIEGTVTDFKSKWNDSVKARLYGEARRGDLDGEYIDSSEGYVTDLLDFRRDHFAATDTPLTYSPGGRKPAIFKGLVVFEYVRGIERDIRRMGKLMMANGTPGSIPWLAPLLDVMGTETNWNRGGRWSPMSDSALLYRRALCRGKPYCFLMNTEFERFSHALVEKYMKRSLAYGMFPGFFSHNASQGHYFNRPKLYERDRPLFRKYVPLCRRVAEAGWQPVTNARSSDPRVYVERFGPKLLTVFNDSGEERRATVTLDGLDAAGGRELVTGKDVAVRRGRFALKLAAEDVAVIELR